MTTTGSTPPEPKRGQSWRSLDLGQRIGLMLILILLFFGGRWGCSHLAGSMDAENAARSIIYDMETYGRNQQEQALRYGTLDESRPRMQRIELRNVSVSHRPEFDSWLVTGRIVVVMTDGSEAPRQTDTTFDLEPVGGGHFIFRGTKEGEIISHGNGKVYPRTPEGNPFTQ